MTTERRLDTRLHSIIGEIAQGPYPDYIEDVLAGTAHRRQRPRWTFPERWLPMDIAAQPLRPARRVPWLGLAVLALLILALVAAVVISGGPTRRVVPPFGRASNGLVAYATAGDIRTVDVASGRVTPVVTGPETDAEPVYSRDGSHFVFLREAAPAGRDLMVARADGTGLVKLTPTPLPDATGWSFSPDGRSVTAVAQVAGRPQLLIVPSDGSAPPRFLDVGPSFGQAPQYRPDGSEILFVGRAKSSAFDGVHAVDPATGVVRTIAEGSAGAEAYTATWSPDGTRIAYGLSGGDAFTGAWTHLVAADGTGDVRLGAPADVVGILGAEWSNDGTRMSVVEILANGGSRSVIVSTDGPGPRVELACRPDVPAGSIDCSGNFGTWSPDDRLLIGSVNEGEAHYLADPVTGRVWRSAWGGEGHPAWQRLAP